MLKLGLLVQGSGNYNGIQVVPSSWIEESTIDQVPFTDDSYGYFWWISEQGSIAAIGYAGQFIYILPGVNALVTATAEPNVSSSKASAQYNYLIGFLQDYIFPSFSESPNH
jgi:CubicO group peptidase (beta-lactamase class C family)